MRLSRLEILAVLLLSLEVLLSNQVTSSSDLFWASNLYLLITFILLVDDVLRPDRGAVSMLASFFFFAFVAIPAAVQTNLDRFPWGARFSFEVLGATYAILSIAEISFLFGRALTFSNSKPIATFVPAYTVRESEFYWRAGICLALICVLLFALAGPDLFWETRGEFLSAMRTIEGGKLQIVAVTRSLSLLAFLSMVLSVSYLSNSGLLGKSRISS
jgi:hypothetical protein